jgi:hypothetical protein
MQKSAKIRSLRSFSHCRALALSSPTPPLGRYMPFLEISRALRSISCFVATTSAAAV